MGRKILLLFLLYILLLTLANNTVAFQSCSPACVRPPRGQGNDSKAPASAAENLDDFLAFRQLLQFYLVPIYLLFFQPPYLWNEIILICFTEDVRRLRIFLFLTYPNPKASQRFSLVQLGEGGMKGVSIRKGAKYYIWVRIFSQSASVDLSGNEKENERKTPQSPNPTAWPFVEIYICYLFIASFLWHHFPISGAHLLRPFGRSWWMWHDRLWAGEEWSSTDGQRASVSWRPLATHPHKAVCCSLLSSSERPWWHHAPAPMLLLWPFVPSFVFLKPTHRLSWASVAKMWANSELPLAHQSPWHWVAWKVKGCNHCNCMQHFFPSYQSPCKL